jgi:hypothetical protein
MAKFAMEIEFDIHDHSPSAHRAFIGTALDHVKLAVGRGADTEGDITGPPEPLRADPPVIGNWKITEEQPV